jgi:glycosyltransferase 2 family protein
MTAAESDLPSRRLAIHEARLFASARDEQRLRRPLDAVIAVAAIGLLALATWLLQPTRAFERSLADALSGSPVLLHNLWVVGYDVLTLLAALAVVATVVRRRWALFLQCVVAAVTAFVLVLLVARSASGDWVSAEHTLGIGSGVAWPAAGITIAAAVLLALAADVTAAARSLGTWAIAIASVAAVLAARTTPTGVMAALLAAVAASAVGRLVAGTAAGRVSREEALELLAGLGISDVHVQHFSRQADGVVLIDAQRHDGERLLVKVVGRDVAEQRRILRGWRSLIYRDGGASMALTRVPGIEREALATLLAEVHAVPVWRVLTAGRRPGSDQVMVLVAEGERVAGLAEESLGPDFAASAWKAVRALHAARFAHLDLGPGAIAVRADGSVALTDFADATTAADPDMINTDDAQLLVYLAVLIGPEHALASAQAALSDGELADLMPFLQPPALPGDLRAAAKAAKLDFEELRAATAAAAGVDVPKLARLRRITIGSLLRSALLVLAAWAIISYFTQLDVDELRDAFEEAAIPLIVAGFVFAQLPRFTQAVSTLGSVPVRLPFLPVYAMQLATNFLNVALPSAAARMALSIRFFQRQGVPPATAVVSGLLDSFVGNVVQAILLGGLLLFSEMSLDFDTGGSSTSGGGNEYKAIVLLGIVCVVAVAVVLVSGRLRRRIGSRLHTWWPEMKAAAGTLRSRQKLAQLALGNLGTELLFATSLTLFVHAFGGNISLIEALFVNLTASLVVMFVPVPGGIGVAEGALVVGLTGFGVSQDVAFAAVISYRISNFYLPPIWGWGAMRWLEQKGYL